MRLDFTLNNRPYRLEVPDHWTVLDLLRDGLALTATKYGCGEGVCGTCTVLLDDEPVRACAPGRESVAHRARRARGAGGQSLSLHGLHEDRRSGAGRGGPPLMRLR